MCYRRNQYKNTIQVFGIEFEFYFVPMAACMKGFWKETMKDDADGDKNETMEIVLFCENSSRLLTINYFRKKANQLTSFYMRATLALNGLMVTGNLLWF